MSFDAIALCARQPDATTLVSALMATDPLLRIDQDREGGVLSLYDDDGRLALAVEGPRLVQVPTEITRLFGAGVDMPTEPVWWIEAHAPSSRHDGALIAHRFATAAVALLGGAVWPATPMEQAKIGPPDTSW